MPTESESSTLFVPVGGRRAFEEESCLATLQSTSQLVEPYRSVMLQFEVIDDAVTVRDVTVDASGNEHRTENTIHADGTEYARPHGYSITARWRGARALEAFGRKDGRVEGRVRYEVSDDGRTLTLSANDRVLRLARSLA